MGTTTTIRRRLLAGSLLVSLSLLAIPGMSLAKSGDVTKTASCSGSSHVKLKVGARDGGLEVEGEVDQNRNGKHWTWTFKNDGHQFASGASTTHAPSGSFSVSRHSTNGAGTDTIVFRAVNPASGEVCRIAATV